MSNLTLIFQINPRISNFLRLFLDVAPSSRAYGGGGGDGGGGGGCGGCGGWCCKCTQDVLRLKF